MNRLARCSSMVLAAMLACAPLAALAEEKSPAELPPPPATLTPPNDPAPAVAAEGWKAETILAYPQINTPSVVTALPDGRILVAEHPLSNFGGKVPEDRILCIHPDGKINVFADHLFAVFGLAYIDGKVLVHHYPVLSVFTDKDSVGVDRKEIIDQTGKPTIGGLNDHIAAQIRLAMDGYLYMDTGDRGVWAAKSNIDGRVADLQGGGLLRIRPDGTEFEVYATGTRNHLDVSINSEDEMFTYDNTDDGHGWWTRFTHMVDGGFYGYPYDYKPDETKVLSAKKGYKPENPDQPFKPYTLWRAAEYGGGSPTGAIAYNEDALPQQFRGSLFHCEWGKGKVQRFAVERDGGTYKVLEQQDMLMKGEGGDLRPTGIAVTTDGTGFLVTDWGYGGWMQKKGAGRLIKLTWAGKSEAAPKPPWYVPAATARPFTATTAELIEGLKHPAESVRLVAQRRIAERGNEAMAPLVALLNDEKAAPHARWFAIWTLDRMEGGKAGRDAIVKLLADPKQDVSVRRQAARQLGTRKADEGTDALVAALNDPDASMRFRAATALGRIGNPAAVKPILAKLDEKDLFTRFALFTALNHIGRQTPSAWPAIVAGLSGEDAAVVENTSYALRNTFDTQLVTALAAVVTDKSAKPAARARALVSLADLHRQVKYWNGQWWGTQPVGSSRPAKTEEWTGTQQVLATIRTALGDPDSTVRDAAIAAIQIAPDPTASDVLVDLYNKGTSAEARRPMLQALAAAKSPQATPLALEVLSAPQANAALIPDAVSIAGASGAKEAIPALAKLVDAPPSVEVSLLALEALSSLKANAAVPVIVKQLESKESIVATGAVAALASIGDDASVDALATALQNGRSEVAQAAAQGLGSLKAKKAIPALIVASKKSKARNESVLALTRMPSVDALDVFVNALAGNNAQLKKESTSALSSIAVVARPAVDAKADAGAIPPAAIPALQEIFDTPAPVTSYFWIGPFARGTPDPFAPENPAKYPSRNNPLTGVGGVALRWQQVKSSKEEQGMVNLQPLVQPSDGVNCFLIAELNSPIDRDVDLLIGSDDFHTVWVNGKQADDDTSNSGWNFDEKRVKAHLVAGKNVILARVGNEGGPYQFSLAVSGDRSGKLYQTIAAKKPARAEYEKFAGTTKGDAAGGSKVFHNIQTVACVKCHSAAIGDGGGIVGPSLAGVGAKYDKAKLIESVLYPSKQIFDGFQQSIVRTKNGDVLSGVIQSESEGDVTLYDASAQKHVIKKSDIDRRKVSELSAMPEGLEQALSTTEFADLIAYLESLREPAPTPAVKK